MQLTNLRAWAGIVVAVIFACAARAEVKVPPVLSSHMVLQRDMAVPIWGTAAAGEKVTVKFRGQQKEAVADAQGKWALKLDALQAGGPDVLTIAGTNTITLEDVLVGEVWVGSGQSNMDMVVSSYLKGDPGLEKLIAAAPYPKIRLMKVGYPGWKEATKESATAFSALLFSFGVPLQKDVDVPVGLMVGAVGGTPSGYWLSEEAFASDPGCKDVIAKAQAAYSPDEAKRKLEQETAAYEQAMEKYRKDVLPRWEKAAADAKAKGQPQPRKPGEPRKPGPALKPGECRGKIGGLYERLIRPFQPFAIRGVLWDQGESGTAIEAVDQFTLMGALIKGWRKEWGQDFAWIHVQKPSGGGCAWDPADPVTDKAEKFAPLPAAVPPPAIYREMHVRLSQHPNTAMAIASDLGPGIHPTNKSGYGARAARVAAGFVYGKKVEYYGPVYASHKIEGNKVRISFTHIGQGLAFKHGDKLQGFAIAGEDKQFAWADAVIDGNDVIVSSPKVANPVAVRYGCASSHPWANLFNKDGLPAIEFRTDGW